MKNLLWTIIPMCIVGGILGIITNKRKQEDERMMKESMDQVKNFWKDTMGQGEG